MGMWKRGLAFALGLAQAWGVQAAERQVYFGDLHLHTSLSFDAYTINTNTLPEDSYRFAQGEPVDYLGEKVQRHAALDFLAVTDHSEYLGVLKLAGAGEGPFAGTDWPKRLHPADPKDLIALILSVVQSVSGDRPPLEDLRQPELVRSNWQREIAAAEKFYRPGKFTSFVAYEWTSMPGGNNLHRNVIFKGPKYPETPFSALDSTRPEDLWAFADHNRAQGIDLIAIPHNSNGSGGLMFAMTDSDGKPIDRVYAETRARNEVAVEITQHKGSSDTHPLISPNDEFADFELIGMTRLTGGFERADLPGDFVRSGLGRGLELESRTGIDPYAFGIIGASDFHSGISATEPDNYPGGFGILDSHLNPKALLSRASDKAMALKMLETSSGGLTGIWADENTRDSLFDALKRREVFGTSGTRLSIRLFAGWSYPHGLVKQAGWTRQAYAGGVPMGGHLAAIARKGAKPRFLIHAVKDPNGGNLDRVQIIKIWQKEGSYRETVFDAVWAGNRKKTHGRVPPVGSTVNVATADYTNDIGTAELKGEWQDPDFDPSARALYYARVLEIPTPRWTTYLAARNNLPLPDGLPPAIQQRAWSSPIYYDP